MRAIVPGNYLPLRISLGVHYYESALTSVDFDYEGPVEEQKFGELLVLALFTVRQLVNLKPGPDSDVPELLTNAAQRTRQPTSEPAPIVRG